jgi:ABC-type glycerol-3-phosphate transport system substrate-binding protein
MSKYAVVLLLVLAMLVTSCATPAATPAPVAEPAPAEQPAAEAPTAEVPAPAGEAVSLTMGSWRVDDVAQLEAIIAEFNKTHPNITIKFDPTNPPDFNATLRTQLEGGTGPDLFYLRSFATSRQLFEEG